MGKLDRSFVYKKFKNILIEKYGRDKADAIWKEANADLRYLLKKYRNIGSDEKMMVFAAGCALCSFKETQS